MTTENKDIGLDDDIEVIGPGQLLKDAREALNLSQAQVAEQLNLRLTLIQSIEEEQFDTNTPSTFIRGYLRNYAKLVNVSENDVLSSYAMIGVAVKQGAEMKSFSQITRKKAENNRLMMVIYLIVFALIALTIVWWWQESSKSEPTSIAEISAENSPAVTSVEVNKQTQENLELSTEEAATDLNESEPDVVTPSLNSNNTESLPAENFETQDEAFEQHQAQLQATTEPEEVSPSVVNDSLVFIFSGDCWVNIFDATGERLAWGIKKSGYIMTVEGQAPFNITLGKPELVSIKYNQQNVDLSGYETGQIAKFKYPSE